MAEAAARTFQTPESPRSATPPLRDWLATMKSSAQIGAVSAPRNEAIATAEAAQNWAPRLVAPQTPEAAAETEDMAELMAENLMLKAKLRVDADRYDELQSILASEIRDLRQHIADEMHQMEAVREERDLWQARAEALAQPLFQKR